jgi:hypothetical protein
MPFCDDTCLADDDPSPRAARASWPAPEAPPTPPRHAPALEPHAGTDGASPSTTPYHSLFRIPHSPFHNN